jgi:hypothetical protein
MKAIHQASHVEVQQQTDAYPAHVQVRSKLHPVDWQDCADGFDFQDKLARDDDIRLEAVADFRAFVEDGNCNLAGEGNACVCQFSAQAELIYGFQQSGAGMSVHLDRQPDHHDRSTVPQEA